MESGKHFLFTTRPVSDAQLRTIYASDQEMYPAPLSFDRLRSWVDACPDLAIAFHEDGDATRYSGNNSSPASGVIIVLSLLRTYWEDLLVGKVKEVDIDATVMFPPVEIEDGGKNEVEVGLHVFHVERFWGSSTGAASTTSGVRAEDTQAGKSGSTGATAPRKGFAEVAVDEAVRRVGGVCESSRGGVEQSCGEGMRRWRICGLSGECTYIMHQHVHESTDITPSSPYRDGSRQKDVWANGICADGLQGDLRYSRGGRWGVRQAQNGLRLSIGRCTKC